VTSLDHGLEVGLGPRSFEGGLRRWGPSGTRSTSLWLNDQVVFHHIFLQLFDELPKSPTLSISTETN
jgi:hypothetical protein